MKHAYGQPDYYELDEVGYARLRQKLAADAVAEGKRDPLYAKWVYSLYPMDIFDAINALALRRKIVESLKDKYHFRPGAMLPTMWEPMVPFYLYAEEIGDAIAFDTGDGYQLMPVDQVKKEIREMHDAGDNTVMCFGEDFDMSKFFERLTKKYTGGSL